jgi:hypothetical protein
MAPVQLIEVGGVKKPLLVPTGQVATDPNCCCVPGPIIVFLIINSDKLADQPKIAKLNGVLLGPDPPNVDESPKCGGAFYQPLGPTHPNYITSAKLCMIRGVVDPLLCFACCGLGGPGETWPAPGGDTADADCADEMAIAPPTTCCGEAFPAPYDAETMGNTCFDDIKLGTYDASLLVAVDNLFELLANGPDKDETFCTSTGLINIARLLPGGPGEWSIDSVVSAVYFNGDDSVEFNTDPTFP